MTLIKLRNKLIQEINSQSLIKYRAQPSIHTTLFQRCIDVETTSFAYWESPVFGPRLFNIFLGYLFSLIVKTRIIVFWHAEFVTTYQSKLQNSELETFKAKDDIALKSWKKLINKKGVIIWEIIQSCKGGAWPKLSIAQKLSYLSEALSEPCQTS